MAKAKPDAKSKTTVQISPPNMQYATFEVTGIAPLVIHRFSQKTMQELLQKQIAGKTASSKKKRVAQDINQTYIESRYISPDGWDGLNAGSIRAAMISACRLVGFKMTLAKLSVFVIQDGWDKDEPQIPLIRIYGDPKMQKDIARTSTGQPYVTIRAVYHEWKLKIKIMFDADQFTLDDVTNLLHRVGLQVGLGEGRPDSKKSVGMGWGLFRVDGGIVDGERKAA